MTMTRNMTRHPICPHKYCIVLRFESDMLHKNREFSMMLIPGFSYTAALKKPAPLSGHPALSDYLQA